MESRLWPQHHPSYLLCVSRIGITCNHIVKGEDKSKVKSALKQHYDYVNKVVVARTTGVTTGGKYAWHTNKNAAGNAFEFLPEKTPTGRVIPYGGDPAAISLSANVLGRAYCSKSTRPRCLLPSPHGPHGPMLLMFHGVADAHVLRVRCSGGKLSQLLFPVAAASTVRA